MVDRSCVAVYEKVKHEFEIKTVPATILALFPVQNDRFRN